MPHYIALIHKNADSCLRRLANDIRASLHEALDLPMGSERRRMSAARHQSASPSDGNKLTHAFDKAGEKRAMDSFVERV